MDAARSWRRALPPGSERAPIRARTRRASTRIRAHGPSLLLAAAAAGAAYAIASALFGTEAAFFAPIAAVVCIGLAAGQRIRRAVEITTGVVLGLVAADLLVRAIGTGPVQLAVAVLLAMLGAVALGTSSLMANQAAVAAVLVVALAPQAGSPLVRLGDALIGGAVALGLGALLAPDPHRAVRRAAHGILDELGAGLRDVAAALDAPDLEAAERALDRVRRVEDRRPDLDAALAAATEKARLTRRRRILAEVEPVRLVRRQLDVVLATARGVARAAANTVRQGAPVDRRLAEAVGRLATSVECLTRWTERGAEEGSVRAAALDAARTASPLLGTSASTDVLVGLMRSATVELLRATGVEHREAVRLLEQAAGRVDR